MAAAAQNRFEDEGWRIRKDGSRFWAHVAIAAMRDEAGQLTGFVKLIRDLTAWKQTEDELRRSLERFQSVVESAPRDSSGLAGYSEPFLKAQSPARGGCVRFHT